MCSLFVYAISTVNSVTASRIKRVRRNVGKTVQAYNRSNIKFKKKSPLELQKMKFYEKLEIKVTHFGWITLNENVV